MTPIRVVLGPLAGLEDALADAVRASRASDPLAPVTVLAGHTLLKRYLPRALALRSVGQLNVRWLRPHELAQSLAYQVQLDEDRSTMSRSAERFLVRELAAGAGGYFAGVAGRDGFSDALLLLFREVEQGGFSPIAFARSLAGSGDASSKEGQLALLYGEYRKRRDQMRFAGIAEHAELAARARLDGQLLVYGIWEPAELYRGLIAQVAGHTAVTVFLAESGTMADQAHASCRAWLASLGAIEERRDAARSDRLAGAVFREPSSAIVDRRVRLISTPDTVREVWEAARACLDWAVEGIRFSEIAVAYRNQDPYRALIDEIFREAHIETYIHDGRALAEHPLGRRILALIELAETRERFPRSEVMEFLSETELPAATAAKYARVRPSEWEAYTREAGVIEGIEQWRERLMRLAADKRDDARNDEFEWLGEVATRVDTLIKFATDFDAALAARHDEATWREHLAFVRSLAQRYAARTQPILDVLGDLLQLEAVRERVTFREFAQAVRDDLQSRDVSGVLGAPSREFGRRGVSVIDATTLRHLRFRAVYLLGVAERAWPPPPRPDPLLLEHERRAVNGSGAGRLPLRTEPDEEALGFWLAIQAAREHLVVSYARADAGRTGKHVPSHFFREVVDALEGRRVPIEALEASPYVERIAAGRLASQDQALALTTAEYDRGLVRAATEGSRPAGIAALERQAPALARAVQARRSRWSDALTPYDGVMTSDEAMRAASTRSPFVKGDAVSPSRLETWTTCPYRYFLRYALGIEPLEEPEQLDRIDHLQRGSLIHEILQVFLTHLGRDDPPSPARRAQHLTLLREVAREAFDTRERMGVTGRPLIWQIDQRQIGEDLVRWYDADAAEIDASGVLPGAFEARFGPRRPGLGQEDEALSTDQPLAFTANERMLLVQGRIDRIDWDDERTRFRVVDYKTGRKRNRDADVLQRGEALQLPVYLHAAASMLGMSPEQGEAQYFYVSSRGGFRRHVIAGAQLAAGACGLEQVLSAAADGIDSGYFALNPAHDHCRWCDYRDICDVRRERIMERKRDDPRAAAYQALEELA